MNYRPTFPLMVLLLHYCVAIRNESQYGIGISLASDYGTVSAYTTNSSFIDIAKIEGGELYKSYMLGLHRTTTSPPIFIARYCLLPTPLCKHWPFQSLVETRNPLAPMLKALLTAAEAALETRMHSAMVSAHDLEDLQTASAHVQNALDEMGVDSWSGPRRVVRHLVSALRLEGACNDTENPENDVSRPQHILAVEYTRKSMSAVMWGKECGDSGDYWRLSRVSSSNHGHDAIAACRSNNTEDSDHCNVDLRAALRNLIRAATNQAKSPALGTVLVFGDKANDENLLLVLRQALRDNFANGASITPVRVQDFSPDLAFAGSRAMAMFELQQKEIQRQLAREGKSEHGEL